MTFQPALPAGEAAHRGVRPVLAVVVKGYPRLSETFIAQELLALQRLGFAMQIWSLRLPTDPAVHPLNAEITAPVFYLPEYLYQQPMRVLLGVSAALRRRKLWALLRLFCHDLARDFTAGRGRRLGQALVMARELDPAVRHVHVHYLHTPTTVVRYTALLTGRTFSFSAHAKDIWTTGDWEKREKIADSAWGVTCTRDGHAELRRLLPDHATDRLFLVYHGLDLARFPPPPARDARDGSDPSKPVRLVTVGRAVAKKGFDDLLRACAGLPPGLHWRLTHVGAGELRDGLKTLAARLGIAHRVDWRGALAQGEVIAELAAADIFVLACKEGGDGDRDGLPNVIMEAATQALPIVSTRFAGVPEFVRDDGEGLLVAPGDIAALARAIESLARDVPHREALGRAALGRVHAAFGADAGITAVAALLDRSLAVR